MSLYINNNFESFGLVDLDTFQIIRIRIILNFLFISRISYKFFVFTNRSSLNFGKIITKNLEIRRLNETLNHGVFLRNSTENLTMKFRFWFHTRDVLSSRKI